MNESDIAWNYFARGGSGARSLCDRLLDSLGAEEEWLINDAPDSVTRMSGPARTTFTVHPVGDEIRAALVAGKSTAKV